MYGQIFVTETARTDFLNFITDSKIFVNEARYRQQDVIFKQYRSKCYSWLAYI